MTEPSRRGAHSIGCFANIAQNAHGASRRSIGFGRCTTAPMNGSTTALRRSRACFVHSGERMMDRSASSWWCRHSRAKAL